MANDIIQQIAARRKQYGLGDVLAFARMAQANQPDQADVRANARLDLDVKKWEAGQEKRDLDIQNLTLGIEEKEREADEDRIDLLALEVHSGMPDVVVPQKDKARVDAKVLEMTRTTEESETAIIENKLRQGEIQIEDLERENPTMAIAMREKLNIDPPDERMLQQGKDFVMSMGTEEAIWETPPGVRRQIAVANKIEKEYDKAMELGILNFEKTREYMRAEAEAKRIEDDTNNYEVFPSIDEGDYPHAAQDDEMSLTDEQKAQRVAEWQASLKPFIIQKGKGGDDDIVVYRRLRKNGVPGDILGLSPYHRVNLMTAKMNELRGTALYGQRPNLSVGGGVPGAAPQGSLEMAPAHATPDMKPDDFTDEEWADYQRRKAEGQ